jgi:hypothetical protein
MAPRTRGTAKPRLLKATATGISSVDALSVSVQPTLNDYVEAVSHYVLQAPWITSSQAKTAQIALSAGLGRALLAELQTKIPKLYGFAGERTVAGALRTARADVSEAHELDGLRLAVEIKPVNLAVGRALWNRFGDIRAFAVNIHLKFPFAVVGGVLAVPTWEWKEPGKEPEAQPIDVADDNTEETPQEEEVVTELSAAIKAKRQLVKSSTTHLLERLERRLERTRKRLTEADPPHLLEAVALLVYDPDDGTLDPAFPKPGNGLRWDEFVGSLVDTYDVRFE